MACGFDGTKTLLCVLNSIYIAVAVFLILVGAYVKGASIVTSHSVIGGIIAVGVFLLLYMVILGCVFLIQLSVTIACLAAVNRDGISELVRTGWKSSSNETIWDAENNFQCCGLEGPHDAAYRCHELACASTFCEPCLGIIVNKMRSNLRRLGGIGLFFSFSELLGIWLAIRYRNLKDPKLDPVLYFQQQSS
ncbi:Tetraspanin-31 [Toxocara canis]|uniref:Tetraspanin-31 n=1 Tax=Toxocara canis TaxID=6265 RepID=A0A0B2VL26_TOXCA|nr:Tetraspanin-31 [Toxocara canis]